MVDQVIPRFMPMHMPDATLNQADPVSTQLYTVLDTQTNVKILSICSKITWAVTQPTPLDIICTVDGITWVFRKDNPVSAQDYLSWITPNLAADLMGDMLATSGSPQLYPYLFESRNCKIVAKITWAVTQPTPLVCRVKWSKW